MDDVEAHDRDQNNVPIARCQSAVRERRQQTLARIPLLG
jgi:hypothetical protein